MFLTNYILEEYNGKWDSKKAYKVVVTCEGNPLHAQVESAKHRDEYSSDSFYIIQKFAKKTTFAKGARELARNWWCQGMTSVTVQVLALQNPDGQTRAAIGEFVAYERTFKSCPK